MTRLSTLNHYKASECSVVSALVYVENIGVFNSEAIFECKVKKNRFCYPPVRK